METSLEINFLSSSDIVETSSFNTSSFSVLVNSDFSLVSTSVISSSLSVKMANVIKSSWFFLGNLRFFRILFLWVLFNWLFIFFNWFNFRVLSIWLGDNWSLILTFSGFRNNYGRSSKFRKLQNILGANWFLNLRSISSFFYDVCTDISIDDFTIGTESFESFVGSFDGCVS